MSDKLKWIAQQAKSQPNRLFNNVMHLIDVKFLFEAYRRVKKRAKPGTHGVTVQDYAVNIVENLERLYERMKASRYRAPAVKRVYMKKEDGKRRPLVVF